MKAKVEKYKNVDEFGRSLGLSDLEMELIRHKKKLIEKLRKAREQQGLSQAELAAMVDSKQPAIARMESGHVSEVSLDFLCKVALALEVLYDFHFLLQHLSEAENEFNYFFSTSSNS